MPRERGVALDFPGNQGKLEWFQPRQVAYPPSDRLNAGNHTDGRSIPPRSHVEPLKLIMNRYYLPLLALAVFAALTIAPTRSYGQAGLRESLERLDKNKNGEIDPEEVTALARPYLERITANRMAIGRRSVEIEEIQEAARRFYSQRNGASGEDIRPDPDRGIRRFGPSDDEPMVPEFGITEVKYPYTKDDLDFADRTMRRCDRDQDGYIDRREALRERWTHRDPFDDDLNEDGKISRLELAQRYARRRMLDQSSDELRRKAWRGGSEIRSFEREDESRSDSMWWRRGGNSYWLTASILGRFDANKNGRLEAPEAAETGLQTTQIDLDRDGELTREELFAHLSELQDQTGAMVEGIPGWFYELDVDRDRQVSMSEFATEWTDAKLEEFTAFDLNRDGLLTAPEVMRSKALVGGSYQNTEAEVLPPGRTVLSEIEVEDDFLIGDLNLQLSITHTRASHLDVFLTGPDGQRIELFTAVGGSDDHFDKTILDDQSSVPIVKARPPFKGTFQPEAVTKRQPSLSYFNGKSIKGVWQLVVQGTRSDRFGMLHSWNLQVTPIDDMLSQPAAPENDGPQTESAGEAISRQAAEEKAKAEAMAKAKADMQGKQAFSGAGDRGKVDYRAINERFQAAVKEGKMTEDQVRQAWIKIKGGGGKSRGDKDESRGKFDQQK